MGDAYIKCIHKVHISSAATYFLAGDNISLKALCNLALACVSSVFPIHTGSSLSYTAEMFCGTGTLCCSSGLADQAGKQAAATFTFADCC
jgi:hypothetical protein